MMQKTVNGVLTQLLHRLIALFLICVESSGLTSILKIKQTVLIRIEQNVKISQ